ncbi:MAG: ROK family protein [Muribaculaceae bacterium]|nr:ROK family protein [Muribaculaceae bacterium]
MDMNEYAIGIDLGGTAIKYAVVSRSGEIPFEGSLPTPATEGADAVISALATAVKACREWAEASAITPIGVGIGTPGIVSPDKRRVLGGAENIAGWENVSLADALEKLCGMRVAASNDANAMAVGEWMFGAARGVSDALFITVGTGIGSAALINGHMWRGHEGSGMEVGHITVKCDGEECNCGGRGCLEHYASTAALVRRYKTLSGREADGREIVRLYHDADPVATQAMSEHWMYLGHGIASVINVFAPERVVVGGGISEAGDFYFERLRRVVGVQVMEVCAAGTSIVPAELGNRAGCLGAAALILFPEKI